MSCAPNALAERIKELNCLYGISNLLENQDVSLSWIMQRAVELIPTAWQFPEHACACITIDDQEYISKNFKKTRWNQGVPISLNGKHVGDVHVYYRKKPPAGVGNTFLEEEDRLLRAIGERLSKVLWLKRSEAALKESEARYRILTEQVAEGVALVQDHRFRYVNPAFCKLFNVLSPEEMIDRPVNRSTGNTNDIAALYESIGEPHLDKKIEGVCQIDRPDKPLWIQVCHAPITIQSKPAILSTFKDITELKEQQMAAERMAEKLDGENRVLRSSLKERFRLGDILGRSPAMQAVYELILKAAATDANVAIFGESGSGKELVARAIHEYSDRNPEKFVAVNCGAIQESLFEREFFGHLKGAFSSAHADSPGYLDMADGGTLFLDEVSELTVNMQAKLLRAIEGGGYRAVGGAHSKKADFRIISASHAALDDNVRKGLMRSDFYYRIQVIQIQLPPLRKRKQDLPLLVEHFLQQMKTSDHSKRVPGHIMDLLLAHDWPGNVRELRNVLQRYVTLGRLDFLSPDRPAEPLPADNELDLREATLRLERSLISKALSQADGNRTKAAELLGISRRALFRKMASI